MYGCMYVCHRNSWARGRGESQRAGGGRIVPPAEGSLAVLHGVLGARAAPCCTFWGEWGMATSHKYWLIYG